MNNQVDYRILHTRIRISGRKIRLSIEAQNVMAGCASLIVSGEEHSPDPCIRRSSGEYSLTYTDTDNDLFIYERSERATDPVQETDPDAHNTLHDAPREGKWSKSPVLLSELVREGIALSRSGSGFHQQICLLPSPPWTYPVSPDGSVVRELRIADGSIRLTAYPARGWSVEVYDPGGTTRSASPMEIGWVCGEKSASGGRFFFTRRGGCRSEMQVSADPALHLAYSTLSETFLLVLPDDLARIVRAEGASSEGTIGSVCWSVHSPGGYLAAVLHPLYTQLCPRLERLFRYARRISGSRSPGAGDVLYAVKPDSGITVSLVLDTSGMGPVLEELRCRGNEPEAWSGWLKETTRPDISHFPVTIPFPHLDTCESWRDRASSTKMQSYLREIRGYVATAFFLRTIPRDLAYEAKACSVITDFGSVVTPVASSGESGSLGRGDILVRIDQADDPHRSRSVFIVQFVQSGSGEPGKGRPVIRGFWLGENNPIATADLEDITEHFGRILVEGDEKYHRMIRQLTAVWQESNHPFTFSRTGSRSDPVIRYEYGGLILIYHSMDRRFRLEFDSGNGEGILSIEETGYPAGSTVVSAGSSGSTRWQGLPLVDICALPSASRVMIVLEDDFFKSLMHNRMIGKGPAIGSEPVTVEFVPRSEAEYRGLIQSDRTDTETKQ